jgi:hypothetical protein
MFPCGLQQLLSRANAFSGRRSPAAHRRPVEQRRCVVSPAPRQGAGNPMAQPCSSPNSPCAAGRGGVFLPTTRSTAIFPARHATLAAFARAWNLFHHDASWNLPARRGDRTALGRIARTWHADRIPFPSDRTDQTLAKVRTACQAAAPRRTCSMGAARAAHAVPNCAEERWGHFARWAAAARWHRDARALADRSARLRQRAASC